MKMYENIPQYIKEHGLFCCWKYENRNGRQTKVPYNPFTGKCAKSNDPGSFVDFDRACLVAAKSSYDGIGLGIFGDICAIDIDHCVNESGELSDLANYVVAIMQSYTELSPSGKGVRILFRSKDFPYDKDLYYTMNQKRGLEVYVAGATSKYVTVTGNRMDKYDFSFGERNENLQLVLDRFMKKDKQQNVAVNTINTINAINSINETNNMELDVFLQRAFNSKNGDKIQKLWTGNYTAYGSQSEADLAFCSYLAQLLGNNATMIDAVFRKSALMRDKWDRGTGGSTYGAITIQRAIGGNAARDEFPPLVDLKEKKIDLPKFPVDALPTIVANQVGAVAKHTQTAEDMAAVMGLGVLAVCLQGKYRVEGSPGYYEPLSLYTVIIASPGERKSAVMGEMTDCLYEYVKDYNEGRKAEIRENRQQRKSLERQIFSLEEKLKDNKDDSLEVQLRNLEIELEQLPVLKAERFAADDCSSEALISLLAENHGRMAVLSTEGGIFETMSGRYSGTANLDVWLKSHCGDTIMVDRKGREPEAIHNPHLSAILAIQPSVLEEIMADKKMNGRGLIARFLFASPPSLMGKRTFGGPKIPEETAREYKELVYRLMNVPVPKNPEDLQLSCEATQRMEIYFAEHEQYLVGDGQVIAEWASKYIGAILRIAGLLHVATEGESKIITAETIENAISIGKYFLEHAQHAYALMGSDPTMQLAKFLLDKIKKKKISRYKEWEFRDLARSKHIDSFSDLIPAVELLEACGVLRREKAEERAGSGRKSDDYVVINPKVLETVVNGKA